jgi:hypothetical protein
VLYPQRGHRATELVPVIASIARFAADCIMELGSTEHALSAGIASAAAGPIVSNVRTL